MSINASRKRRDKHWHRNQFGVAPLAADYLNWLIVNIVPVETPLLQAIKLPGDRRGRK